MKKTELGVRLRFSTANRNRKRNRTSLFTHFVLLKFTNKVFYSRIAVENIDRNPTALRVLEKSLQKHDFEGTYSDGGELI